MDRMRWRPEGWRNISHIAKNMVSDEIQREKFERINKVFEAGADAMLASLINCGIIKVSQLEGNNGKTNKGINERTSQ